MKIMWKLSNDQEVAIIPWKTSMISFSKIAETKGKENAWS